MRAPNLAFLTALVLVVGCGAKPQSGVAPAASTPTASTATSPRAAIDQAALALGSHAQKTKDENKSGLFVKAYKLSGMTMAEAIAKLDPVLLPAGFAKRGDAKGPIVTYVMKGAMVMITNPDPVRLPDQFQMTTMVHHG